MTTNGRPPSAKWAADGFDYGEFRLVPNFGADIGTVTADYPSFILMKDARNVADYEAHLTRTGVDLLELGIMKGGSCAFFEALLRPQHHLAIDVYGFPNDGLAELAAHVGSQGRTFRAEYKTSQSDIARILDHWEAMTGRRAGFDVIIDDASHNYELSLASFHGLFPLLKPGGVYALEDWGWAHWGGPWQDEAHPEFRNPALSNLVVHAVLATTGGSGFVESVKVTPNAAFIVRGPNPGVGPISIAETYPSRSRPRTTL